MWFGSKCPYAPRVFILNKMEICKIIEYVISLPKSIYVSFRLLPFKDAVRIPMFVRYNCSLLSLKGSVKIMGGGKNGFAASRFWKSWNI